MATKGQVPLGFSRSHVECVFRAIAKASGFSLRSLRRRDERHLFATAGTKTTPSRFSQTERDALPKSASASGPSRFTH